MGIQIRKAQVDDIEAIRNIYNQGIADRIATLETDQKDAAYMRTWYEQRQERHAVLVAEIEPQVIGWASINPYSHRCAYNSVGDISIYIDREHRGKGIGHCLLQELDRVALENGFHKLVLFTFPFNQLGQGLYRRSGYREVGIFQNQGILDGEYIDIMAMEKLLRR
ncbi:arsinothricin resistance N-acetyltransferase ArsN1 family A [Brevibacillus sp. SYSU BS000544]|uniref:arsinothricin resistance N-acetyltransferase ArsN1 family A n=1 Tax=Brevibacillus sp. SYSU BS000544 TaxID=3416443 RepID=UPI003CE546A4